MKRRWSVRMLRVREMRKRVRGMRMRVRDRVRDLVILASRNTHNLNLDHTGLH